MMSLYSASVVSFPLLVTGWKTDQIIDLRLPLTAVSFLANQIVIEIIVSIHLYLETVGAFSAVFEVDSL